MMKAEFEKLAGYEVSTEDYSRIIEPMYMATDLSKQEFVKVISKERFALKTKAQYISEMKKISKHLYDTCSQYYDTTARDRLNSIVEEYVTRFYNGIGSSVFYNAEKSCTCCYYPRTLEIFNSKNYQIIESIELL